MASFCSACGCAVRSDDRFCAECGVEIPPSTGDQNSPAGASTITYDAYGPMWCLQDGCTESVVADSLRCAAHESSCAVSGCAKSRVSGVYCNDHSNAAKVKAAEQATPRGSAAIVCQHCGERGSVRAWRSSKKGTTSLGKVAINTMTLGITLPLLGGTRKTYVTQFRCGNCKTTWSQNR